MDTHREPDNTRFWETLANVWRIRQYVNRVMDQQLAAQHGLDWRGYVALKLIEQGVVSPGEIAETMGVAAYVASRIIEPLLEQGLVDRRFDPQDARRTRLALTEAGQTRLCEAAVTIETAIRSYTARIPPERRAQLLEIIDELARNIPPA